MPDGTVKDIEDEIPFDVPEGWAWCRLGEICDLKAGKSISATDIFSDNSDAKYLCYGGNGIRGYVKTYNRDGDYVLIGRQGALCGNINYAFGKFYATEHAVVVENRIDIDIGCLGLFLETLNLNQYATSTAQPGLSVKTISEVFFPLPPLNEQCRIVERIKRLFNLIDSLEKDRTDLQIAIKQAKSKILDLAIHGKLVEQDSADEPASVLLEKLRAEKEIKIKAGELKRDKNDSYIYKSTTDNCHCEKFADGTVRKIDIPFDLPDSWSWCNGYELFNPMKSRKPSGLVFKYIDIETIDNKKHRVIRPKELSVSEAPSRASREVANGDVLFSLVRPYLENIALITEENQDCIASTGFFVCKPKKVLDSKFLFFLMTTSYVVQGLNEFMKGDNSPSINGDDILRWLYPLPPLSEQKRIVEKIENAFAKLDFIAEQLT